MENDTNMLVYDSSNKKANKGDHEPAPPEKTKKKLTRKERIRLEKVVERKDKSSKVG